MPDLTVPVEQTDPDITPPADPVPTATDAWIAHGHKIIRDNLARARAIGGPQIAQLLPVIEATLHDLFSHFTISPDDFARHQDDVAAQAAADRAAANPPPAPLANDSAPPPPIWAADAACNDTVTGGSLFDPDPAGPPTPRPTPAPLLPA